MVVAVAAAVVFAAAVFYMIIMTFALVFKLLRLVWSHMRMIAWNLL